MQGKLKPNVSDSAPRLNFLFLQQLVKKNVIAYRSNAAAGDKPVSAYNSAASLVPLQSSQAMGPGQKLTQPSMGMHKKPNSIMSSTDNLKATINSALNQSIRNIVPASTQNSTKPSQLIRLSKVQEHDGMEPAGGSEEKLLSSPNEELVCSTRSA